MVDNDEVTTLIQNYLDGDPRSFDKLYHAFDQELSRWVSYRNVPPEDNEDICQLVWMRVHKHLGTFNPNICKFRTWIQVIADRIILNYFRDNKRRALRVNSFSDLNIIDTDVYEMTPADEDSLESSIANHKLQLILSNIDKLNHEHAEALLLRLNGFSYKDISSHLSISLGTVKSRLSRARKTITSIIDSVDS